MTKTEMLMCLKIEALEEMDDKLYNEWRKVSNVLKVKRLLKEENENEK